MSMLSYKTRSGISGGALKLGSSMTVMIVLKVL